MTNAFPYRRARPRISILTSAYTTKTGSGANSRPPSGGLSLLRPTTWACLAG